MAPLSKEWYELPNEVRMSVTAHYAQRLIGMALEAEQWSVQELRRAIKHKRIVMGFDNEGVYIYYDEKPIAGAVFPKVEIVGLENEQVVFIKGGQAEAIPALKECRELVFL